MNKKNLLHLILQSYIIFAAVSFGIIAYFAHLLPYFPNDITITKAFQHINAAWFDSLMKSVSFIGYEPQILIIISLVAIFLFLNKHKWESAVSLFSSAAAFLLGTVIKELVHRPRPSPNIITIFKSLHDPSFPSGHVLNYTVFFGFLLFLTYYQISKSLKRTVLIIFFSLLIILIGPSRIYLGEHWASDVLGAYLLGSVVLAATIYVYRWGKEKSS